jgi:hypothetical protein
VGCGLLRSFLAAGRPQPSEGSARMKCTKDERECVTAASVFRRTFTPRLRNEEMNMEKLIHFLEGMKRENMAF